MAIRPRAQRSDVALCGVPAASVARSRRTRSMLALDSRAVASSVVVAMDRFAKRGGKPADHST
jgi:hypothetical protein